MAKIVPGRKYTKAQIQLLVGQAEADELQMQGFALRYDVSDHTYTLVHWTQAGGNIGHGQQRIAVDPNPDWGEPLRPIVKRTPQERLDALMLKFIDDCKAAGTVPGLDDARIGFIIGEAWKAGRSEVTGEMVRRIARHFLEDAEKKKAEADSHRVTRQGNSS